MEHHCDICNTDREFSDIGSGFFECNICSFTITKESITDELKEKQENRFKETYIGHLNSV